MLQDMSSPPRAPSFPVPRWALCVLLTVVAAAPLVVHRQLLSDDLFLYTYDAGQSHLARFQIMDEALNAGRLPLWQTVAYGGSPFFANPENPALYPPALAALALAPPLLAMNLTAVVHMSLAAMGMALLVLSLARRYGLQSGPALAGALLAAVFFSLNWYTRLEHLNLVTYGAAHALIPWILLALDRVLNGAHPRRAAGALALATAAQIATGGLYVVAYTGLTLILWTVVSGVCAGPARRRRALSWCLLAAGLACIAALARLLPYQDWVAVTNRAGALPLGEALGRTLGGHESFSWTTAARKVGHFLGGGPGGGGGTVIAAALVLSSLALLRRRSVAAAWLLLIVGATVALGPGYQWLHAWVPPFDRVRNALRGWTLVNAAWPLLAGLGFAASWQALSERWKRTAKSSTTLASTPLIAAGTLTAVLWPQLLDTGEHAWMIDEPFSRQAVLDNYPNWNAMAEKAGDDWRAMALNVRTAGTRNEQFIAAALGLETPAGFMGFAFPVDLARHLYTNDGRLEPKQRLRRAKALSVRHATVNEFMSPRGQIWDEIRTDPFPGGVDGPLVWDDPAPRPRAFLPGSVGLILGEDPDKAVLYSIYDAPAFRPEVASLISLDGSHTPDLPPESIDILVVIDGPSSAAPATAQWIAAVAQRGTPIAHVTGPPRRKEVPRLSHMAELLSSGEKAPASGTFERLAPGEVTVELPPAAAAAQAAGGRWLVLSESWQLWGGWDVRAQDAATAQYRADAVATAVWLPPAARSLSARYNPPGIDFALGLGAAAILVALALCFWPAGRAD
ncbi:MAG: hypothetical protein ACI9EF_002587 [Pseudohongiellaceae bacterium]|jgi:hypothetical protein